MNTQLQLDFDGVYDGVVASVKQILSEYKGEILNHTKTLGSNNPKGIVEVETVTDLWIELYTARLRVFLPTFDRTQLNVLTPDSAVLTIFKEDKPYLTVSVVRNLQSRVVSITVSKV